MLRNQPVIAFVATTDSERSKVFYRDVLGLTLIRRLDHARRQ